MYNCRTADRYCTVLSLAKVFRAGYAVPSNPELTSIKLVYRDLYCTLRRLMMNVEVLNALQLHYYSTSCVFNLMSPT